MDIDQTPCPVCNERALRIETGWHAMPIGSFSLSGHQLKFSARRWPFLVCGSCGLRAPAKGTPEDEDD